MSLRQDSVAAFGAKASKTEHGIYRKLGNAPMGGQSETEDSNGMEPPSMYSPINPSAFFMMQRRQRLLRNTLRRFSDAREKKIPDISILEIGCGGGQWMVEFQMFGVQARNCAGIDIDETRTDTARQRVPQADVKTGDAAELPWKDASFDIVFQSTVFTSVLDAETKKRIAAEMRRVCSPDGLILWYDFAFDNPKNPNVKGVGKREIRDLFAPWKCEFKKITLAPPIARKLTPMSWFLAETLETFCPPLRTHLWTEIHPPPR